MEELFDDETVVVAGAGSRWAHGGEINLNELAEAKWILPPADTTNSIVVMEAFRARRVDLPQVSFVTFSVALRTSLLSRGDYLSVLPRSMANLCADQMGLVVLPMQLPMRKWPVIIVTLKNRTLNPVAKVFIDHMRAGVKALDIKDQSRRHPDGIHLGKTGRLRGIRRSKLMAH